MPKGLPAPQESKHISRSHSLEDGEILEGLFSGDTTNSLPQLHLNQGRSVPASTSVGGLARTVEPLTREDLDRAKSLVLDLLGWGVTPEYLVECGLSPGAVYTIFTDLRLRLPRNLDIPFTPAPRGAQ